MELKLQTEYWNNLKAREAFKRFIMEIHGLDFTAWESAGYWDFLYTPFSYFKGDKIIASMCVYLLDAVIDTKKTRIAQISGVGTDPLFRRQGLNKKLTTLALEWVKDKTENGIFLFADDEAVPFYNTCGFLPVMEHIECTEAQNIKALNGLIQLSPDNPQDFKKIENYVNTRNPISDTFSVMNNNLLMFHLLYSKRKYIYEIPNLECLISFKRQNTTLSIYDIIGSKIPSFQEFFPYITNNREKIIEFHFHTDKLKVQNITKIQKEDSSCFIMGTFPFKEPVFPSTSHA